MSMLEGGQTNEIAGEPGSARSRTHSFFAGDFPESLTNFFLILSHERTPSTHPTSLFSRSKHSGQRIT